MFWDTFCDLCDKKGISPNHAAAQLGYSNSICTRWSNGTSPKAETLVKISAYFDVSIDYLLEEEITKERQRLAEGQQAQAEESREKTNKQKNKPNKKVKDKKIKNDNAVELIFDFEFASAPPNEQPDPIIEEIDGKKRIINFEGTDEVWVQTAAYDGIFPSFDKKAGYIKYTASELEELMNEDDLKL